MSKGSSLSVGAVAALLGGLHCADAGRPGTTSTPGSSGSTSGAAAPPPCPPPPSCPADPACVGLVENAGKNPFGLRMSSLTFTRPAALTDGVAKAVIVAGVTPPIAGCNLAGNGLFSWLLEFDLPAGTLKTGVAAPVSDPTLGYAFIDGPVTSFGQTFDVAPATYPDLSLLPDGSFSVSGGRDLLIVVYLDSSGASVVVLPVHELRLSGRLSDDRRCIGRYNAEGLDPAHDCQADAVNPSFVAGATLDGYVLLAEADEVPVPVTGASLCVLLTGESDGAQPISHCPKVGGALKPSGDFCSATGMPSTPTCADAFSFEADFSASAIRINL